MLSPRVCDTISFVLILAFLLIRPFVAQAFYIPSESMESTLLKKDRLIVDKFSYRLGVPQRGDVVVFNAPPAATGGEEGIDFIKRLIALPGDTVEVKAAQLLVGEEKVNPGQYGFSSVHDYLRSRLGLGDVAVKIFPDYILVGGNRRIEKKEIAEQLGQPSAKITLIPGETIVSGKVMDEPYTNEDPGYTFPEDGGAPVTIETGKLWMMGDNRNHSADSHFWGQLDNNRVVGKARVVFWPPNRFKAIK